MRVVFMGSPEFALPSLRAVMARHEVVLVMSQPDKPAGRGKELTAPPVKRLAVEAALPTYQPRSARAPEVADALRATGADIGVVVAYGKILPRAVLDAFPKGCINVHGSVLPAYRGAAPVQWAVIHGDAESGVTIMQLDEGMDTGPMLLVRREPVRDDDTAGTLAARLAEIGAAALLEAMDAIAAGTAVATPQDGARATHAPMLEKSTGQVDWTRDADAVRNLVRGVDPWPGATTLLGGEPLKLFGAGRADGQGAPGTVLAVDERGAVIACGTGAVRVAELQAAGKKRMAALELVRGRKLAVGALLGP
ncbi:MAG TPA: methionyl-tRNA formyltransferase [Kofleriaceae bacterium]|nr:methionyl-tRNA formyltransferase [Kofleriaceae bacterium]